MAKRGGLGSGLDALFGLENEEEAAAENRQTLPISRVEPRADQPRQNFDPEAMAEL